MIWVFTPIYKDVDSFRILRERVLGLGLNEKARFVVIDDAAGADPAVAGLRELPDVHILTCATNRGHQDALVFGLRSQAENIPDDDIVASMDGDGQDQPSDLPRLLTELTADNIVLARRTKRKETLKFKVMYVFFKIAFRLLTGLSIKSGNFALMRGRTLKKVIVDKKFNLCYSSTLTYVGTPVNYVGCERGDRFAGQSRMNTVKLMKHGFRMMLPFHDRIEFRLSIVIAIIVGFLVFRR